MLEPIKSSNYRTSVCASGEKTLALYYVNDVKQANTCEITDGSGVH